jgi:hypothetical protein
VRPGPKTGSRAVPSSEVREKSYFRLCSSCYQGWEGDEISDVGGEEGERTYEFGHGFFGFA